MGEGTAKALTVHTRRACVADTGCVYSRTIGVVIGLAGASPERARTEVRSLLRGQWADGMIPHMVFHPQPVDYRPGPELSQPTSLHLA